MWWCINRRILYLTKNLIETFRLFITCAREVGFDRSNKSIFSAIGRWEVICVKWLSGRPLSGDICGGNGGEIDRRRSICDGTWDSGDGTGVVDDEEFVLGKFNERLTFVVGICLWLIGVERIDNGTFGTLS